MLGWLILLFDLIWSVTYFMVMARFFLMIFYPGTLLTQGLFHAIHPVWPQFIRYTDFFLFPLIRGAQKISLLAGIAHWFPSAPVAEVLNHFVRFLHGLPWIGNTNFVGSMLSLNYEQLYPGKFEWLALISLFILSRLRDICGWISGKIKRQLFLRQFPTPYQPSSQAVSTYRAYTPPVPPSHLQSAYPPYPMPASTSPLPVSLKTLPSVDKK